ncbi:hypothetical protein TNCV_2304911 [Trichonephila clavipes]|nr:hypothetical protein TNCV_2304911 [Trichonephila clavipes]
MDVCTNDIASLHRRSTEHDEHWHVYVSFCGEGYPLCCSSPPEVALQHINFYTDPSIVKLPTWMSTWLYRQHFAMFPLNRYYIETSNEGLMHVESVVGASCCRSVEVGEWGARKMTSSSPDRVTK